MPARYKLVDVVSRDYQLVTEPEVQEGFPYWINELFWVFLLPTRRGLPDQPELIEYFAWCDVERHEIERIRQTTQQNEFRRCGWERPFDGYVKCVYWHDDREFALYKRIRVLQPDCVNPAEAIRIVSEPPAAKVVIGNSVTFRAELTTPLRQAHDIRSLSPSWQGYTLLQDRQQGERAPWVRGPSNNPVWDSQELEHIGIFRAVLQIQYLEKTYQFELPIFVTSLDDALEDRDSLVTPHSDDIYNERQRLGQSYMYFRSLAAQPESDTQNLSEDERDAFIQRMQKIQRGLDTLDEIITRTARWNTPRIPVQSEFLHDSNPPNRNGRTWRKLGLFIQEDPNANFYERWKLFDFTDPHNPEIHREYKSATPAAVINNFHNWNRYARGGNITTTLYYGMIDGSRGPIQPNIARDAALGHLVQVSELSTYDKTSQTNGDGWLGIIQTGFEYVAIGATVALFVAVPGSAIASLAFWAALTSSTAAAVMNVAHNHRHGLGNWRDDVFDIVTIAGNLLGIGATMTAMTRGAKLVSTGRPFLNGMCLYGQFLTDGFSGLMAQERIFAEIEEIRNEPDIPPDHKFLKVCEKIAQGVAVGAIAIIQFRRTILDVQNASRRNIHTSDEPTPDDLWNIAKDPHGELTLPEATVEGSTGAPHSTDFHTTTAQTGHRAPHEVAPEDGLTVQERRTYLNRFRTYKTGSGSALGDNMESVGRARPPGTYEAHHVVEAGDARAQPARDVLEYHGIRIDNEANGAWLERRSSRRNVDENVPQHPRETFGTHDSTSRGIHSPEYMDEVNARLTSDNVRWDHDAVVRALREMAGELEDGRTFW